MTTQSQNFRLSKPTFYTLDLFVYDIDVFTYKRISPDLSFESNQRPANFLILTPRCAVWLRCVMHTAEFDSTVCSTLRSQSHWASGHCFPQLNFAFLLHLLSSMFFFNFLVNLHVFSGSGSFTSASFSPSITIRMDTIGHGGSSIDAVPGSNIIFGCRFRHISATRN